MKKRWTHRSRLHGRNITAVATDDSCTGSKYIRFLYAVVGRSAAGIIGRGMSCPKKWQSIRNTDSDYFGACAGNSDRTGARSVIARRNYNRQSKIPQMFHCIKKKFFLPGRKCGPSADRNIYKVKRIRIFYFQNPVDPFQYSLDVSVSFVVEDFTDQKIRIRCNTGIKTGRDLTASGKDACNMSPMTTVIMK